jgi:spermidine/putrescine transport system permease protein
VLNTDYLQIFARSIGLAATTAIVTLVIAFPVSLWMAFQPPHRRTFLLFIVTVPFWTNLLVRNYSWILLLRNGGVLDWVLMSTGLRHEPLNILYSPLATEIGLVYSFLPFMVLPVYVSLEKLDRRLVEAAFDLGADRLRALTRIIIPLSMPGIVGGLILVFVPCLGAFVTPALLGGGKSLMIGSLIQLQFGQSRNWPFGAALAFVLLALVLAALALHSLRYRRVAGGTS